ncbi:MAG TPA: zinc-ribbon domain-containing protein [Ktedonobacteraceae bacterium]
MQQACTQCGSLIQANSQFCTNCGATRAPAQAYRQSWEAPVQNPSQVPPWAQAQGGMYQQQQMMEMNNPNNGGSLGFGGSSDTQANKLLKIAAFSILGGVLLFIVCIALAVVIPIDSVRTFFIVVAILLIVIPWIVYVQIRRIVRRTIGGFWRFF